ncbi:glycosyltransferase family 15 protein [Neoconidiobolus thromboides FSU 785]|nr:glycosyltransferase family 15 protein [Neoconidiobolus thromboides FSU 785]
MEGGGEEIKNLRYSIREIEDRFNSKYNYPYVILSPKPLSEKTMLLLSYLTKAKLKFGVIPYKHWSIPKDIDRQKARKARKELNVIHADSLLFRHHNRYWTGFFFRHELTKEFDYYMKIDGGAQFNCDMKDPFEELKNNKKLYGFTQSVYELEDTIKSLWSVTKEHFNTINKKDLEFVSEDEGNTYNLCHYWNSFEVASFSVFRNQKYLDYFNELEKQGGIFYERWAEGPIKTLFLNFALNRNQIHFFDQIGFYKHPYQYCPKNQAKGENGKVGPVCACDPKFSSELMANTSCNLRWYNLTGWGM